MAIKLFDSLTREIRELQPSHGDGVFRFYNCGPTVYAPAHIGNFRTFVVNDVIRRLLELEFGAAKVKHVRNLTDVDDKTIKRARDERRPLAEVTKQWTDKFHADCAALNCLPPHVEPTATGHIREQVDMIDVLMKNGNAYRAADGSVYFKVSSFDGYGRLSRVKERELQLGSALAGKSQAVDADEKEDGSDFALWKAHKPEDGDNAWDSPWGRGRPGWHIECSAMSKKHLGETIDLHTGGVDLLFPHHENEIAQSECCNGAQFSRHWYHSEHLLVDGKKMSKSLGNLYTLDDLVAKGFSPMALRYALLAGHPRKQLNFTLDSLHAAESALRSIEANVRFFCERAQISFEHFIAESTRPTIYKKAVWWHNVAFRDALHDDLNTPAALGNLFSRFAIVRQGLSSPSTHSEEDMREYLAGVANAMFALGLSIAPASKQPTRTIELSLATGGSSSASASLTKVTLTGDPSSEVQKLAEKRWAAKQAKDFATADALRKDVAAAGWSMLDRKDGYSLEPAKSSPRQ